MRAVTIAAAGAALLTSVTASSHVKMMHARLHQRDDWTADPTSETVTWEDWSTTEDPATTSTPATTWSESDWTTTVDADSTSCTDEPDSATSTDTWGDWTSTSVDPSTTTSSTESWSDWSSTSVDPSTTSSESWGDWTSTSVDPTTTSSESWADWTSSADPTTTTSESWGDWSSSADPSTTTSETWGDWSSSADPTTSWEDWSSTVTVSSTTTTTITVAYASSTSDWSDWNTTSTTPAAVTSTVAPEWSSDGWFGPGWGTATDMCAVAVVTSYGAPTWYPTPEASSTTPALTLTVTPTPLASSTDSWADWSSSTSEDPSTTTSWEDWSSTSSDPADSTTTTSWADWTSTASDGAESTTTAWADWSSSAVETATSTASGSGWAPTSTGIASNGNSWGMTYSLYDSEGGCKDAGTVAGDLASMKSKGFTTVRVYSTDCGTLEHVGNAARDNGLKLILGVFISKTGIAGAKGQITDITGWAQWDLVELIVVGNEAAFNGFCTASELAGFISSSSWAFKAAGYTGPVTTTEPLDTWTSSGSTFCGVVDVVAANLYAFFNAQTTADKAGDFIQSEIGELSAICPGKETYVMESGWPSAGECNGLACPSPENQATALKSIQSTSGAKVIFFSYEDETWKDPGQFGVEQHWGCNNVF